MKANKITEQKRRWGLDYPIVISNHWLREMEHSIAKAKNQDFITPLTLERLTGEEIFIQRIRAHARHEENKDIVARVKECYAALHGIEDPIKWVERKKIILKNNEKYTHSRSMDSGFMQRWRIMESGSGSE